MSPSQKFAKFKVILRFLFYPLFAIFIFVIIAFAIADFIGLPTIIEDFIREKIAEKKLSLKFKNIKCGIVNGITLENIQYSHNLDDININCTAAKLKLSIDFIPELETKITDIDLIDGNILISSVKQATNESVLLSLNEINSSISLTNNQIEIENLHFECSEIPFSIKGKILNFTKLKNLTKSSARTQQVSKANPEPQNKKKDYKWLDNINYATDIIRQNKKKSTVYISFDLDLDKNDLILFKSSLKTPSFTTNEFNAENILLYSSGEFQITDEPIPQFSLDISINSSSLQFKDFNIEKLAASAKFANPQSDHNILNAKEIFISAYDNKLQLKGSASYSIANKSCDSKLSLNLSNPSQKILSNLHLPPQLSISENFQLTVDANLSGNTASLNEISVNANFIAQNMTYSNIECKKISSDMFFKDSILSAKKISIETQHGKINVELDYSFNDKAIFSKLIFSGCPDAIISTLLSYSDNENIRNHISKLKFSKLSNDTSLSTNIFLNLANTQIYYFINSSLTAKNISYNDISFSSFSAQIYADSDSIISIPLIKLSKNEKSLSLSMIINDSGVSLSSPIPPNAPSENQRTTNSYISFSAQNNLNPQVIFNLFPEETKLDWLSFEEADFCFASGFIDLNQAQNTIVRGKLHGTSAKIANIKLDRASAQIEFKNFSLNVNEVSADFYNGKLNGNFSYDFNNQNGILNADARNFQIHKLLASLDPENKSNYAGIGNISLKTNILDKKENFSLNGNGTLKIENCKILNIPILYQLIKAVGNKILDRGWAEISTISADFTLDKTLISSDNIKTNGNIIALEGYGYYDWHSDYADFNVKINPLKEFLPMKILAPITNRLLSIIELKYVGYKDNRIWLPTTGVLN